MISMRTLSDSLSKKLVFKKLSPQRAESLSKKRDRLRSPFMQSVVVPASQLKKYVRISITLDIGIILSELDIYQMSFDKHNYEELHSFWYDPHSMFH